MSVGHDEYWSGGAARQCRGGARRGREPRVLQRQRDLLEDALGEQHRRLRHDHRTLVSYKETHANAKIDPSRDVDRHLARPALQPAATAAEPENALTGHDLHGQRRHHGDQGAAADGKLRLWRNTSVASLAPGQTATLAATRSATSGTRTSTTAPARPGLIDLSSTTVDVPQDSSGLRLDLRPGYRDAPPDALPRTERGARVRRGHGPVVLGPRRQPRPRRLDARPADAAGHGQPVRRHGRAAGHAAGRARVGGQPRPTRPRPRRRSRHRSTAPTSRADSRDDHRHRHRPSASETAAVRSAASRSRSTGAAPGTRRTGAANWTYTWTPRRSRQRDDQGARRRRQRQPRVARAGSTRRRGHRGPARARSGTTPSLPAERTPTPARSNSGVKFRSDVDGFITGLRFYKAPATPAPTSGHLWTATGTQLAEATFTGETASGWQEVDFAVTRCAIDADTTYVASYHAPTATTPPATSTSRSAGVDSPPLHALGDGDDGPNGVYKYGPSGGLFSDGGPDTFKSSNYWVDVVFDDRRRSRTRRRRTINSSVAGTRCAVGVDTGADVTRDLQRADGRRHDQRHHRASSATPRTRWSRRRSATTRPNADVTLDPTDPLQHSTTYTATSRAARAGSPTLAGNALAADATLVVHDGRATAAAARRGAGRPDPGDRRTRRTRSAATTRRSCGPRASTSSPSPTSRNVTPAVLDALRRRRSSARCRSSAARRTMLTDWVQRRRQPDRDAPGPAARRPARPHRRRGRRSPNGYLKVDTGAGPGAGSSARRSSSTAPPTATRRRGAPAIATLFADASTATANPAVTLRSVGPNGGQAAAFTYDLARSVVYTRQGNPAWAGQERDGQSAPIRSDDLFFGAKAGDVAARLGRPRQGRDPAGRRAAAAAGQPDRADEPATASRCRASGTSRATRRPRS